MPHPARWFFRPILVVFALAGGIVSPVLSCPVQRRAELPVAVLGNFLLAPVTLDGGRATLLVDTGAETTTVTPAAVAMLRLQAAPSGTMLQGVGGAVRSGGTVRLRRLQLGGLERAGLALDIAALPLLRGPGQTAVAGLLGLDVLGDDDLVLDLKRRRMALYAPSPCPGFVPPGFAAADGVALHRQSGGLLFLTVRIDGHAVRALLDTGARHSLLASRAAAALGVSGADLARDSVVRGHGIGPATVGLRRHRFGDVRVGRVAVRNMVVDIGALPVAGADLLLGADWLAGRRVWISRGSGRLYVR